MSYRPKPATDATAAVNREAVASYPMDDRQDFADADRGFIAAFPGPVESDDGRVMFDSRNFDYLADDAEAPDTVNPSLWRQSQVMRRGGLYKVVDGVYQVRNNDIANLTVVEGESGLVVIDCMAAVEPAKQAMAMIREHVSDKPVAAIVYTHTHIDHYGGVKGVVDPKDVALGKGADRRAGHDRLVRQARDRRERHRRQRHGAPGRVRVREPARPERLRMRDLRHRHHGAGRDDRVVPVADRPGRPDG